MAFEDVGPEGLDAAGRCLFYDVDGSRDVDGVHCFCEPLDEKGGERLFGDDDSDYSGVGGDEALLERRVTIPSMKKLLWLA